MISSPGASAKKAIDASEPFERATRIKTVVVWRKKEQHDYSTTQNNSERHFISEMKNVK